MTSIEVDTSRFSGMIPKLAALTKKSLFDVVVQQSKLLLRVRNSDEGLIPYTAPPKGAEQGRSAVERDIRKVYMTGQEAAEIAERGRSKFAARILRRYFRNGETDKALAILNNTAPVVVDVAGYTRKGGRVRGYSQKRQRPTLGDPRLGRITSVSQTLDPSFHKARRSRSAGTVRRREVAQIVLSKGSLSAYIKKMKARVGILKAGWLPAAQALNALPATPKVVIEKFIANAPGIYGAAEVGYQGESPYVTMTNKAKTIRRSLGSVIGRALRGRELRMKADIENRWTAIAEKAAR